MSKSFDYWMRKARTQLEGKNWIKARNLAVSLNISPQFAGRILENMNEWIPWTKNKSRIRRVWVRKEIEARCI